MNELLDKKQASKILHCSVSKIEKMMKAGEIGFIKIGTLVRFRESDLAVILAGATASHRVAPGHNALRFDIMDTRLYESGRSRK